MAERRMFAKTIIDSDAFLEMPSTSQLLYFHLLIRADDDGFINKPKTISRMIGTKDDDMKILITKKFILPFESGVVVVKHWKIHNYIQNDRYTETKYKNEKSLLFLDENKAYKLYDDVHIMDTKCIQGVYNANKNEFDENDCDKDVSSQCIQDVSIMDTQVRLGKVRLEKTNVDFFEKLWGLYPKKEGKGQVSKTQKENLSKIGIEEMTRAVERYVKAKKDTDKKFLQNGSTFFNSGYVDYLDKECKEESSGAPIVLKIRRYDIETGQYIT